ncbi:MAG: serine hydrolase domain-containing protein [Lentimicrobium sp.]|jgi:CubicO group peptidase (beta-lactamase class C family)|nr:serine hydrolase domain-containing protein [Lentimicrobium sp.]
MRLLLKLTLVFLIVFFTTGNVNRISSANNSETEILTNSESLHLSQIIDSRLLYELDSLTDVYATQKGFSGNVLVAIDGLNVFEKSLKYADPILKKPFQSTSIFQLASVSKQFTAAAILLLKSDHLIDLDDELTQYIPELPYKDVTIRQLLHHTGGLPNYMYLVDKYWNKENAPDNEDVIELMAKYKLPIFFKAGYKYDYSNTGYVMLASIVERVSGLTLNDFLQRRVFGPLGMKNTYVYSSADTSVTHRQEDGFRALRRGYARISETKNNGPVGDKGVCSTTGDLFLWDQALYNGSPISFDLLEEAFLPVKSSNGKEVAYGFGFRLKVENEQPVIYHNGVWEGFRTNFHRFPSTHNTIIVLNNTSTRLNHELVHDIDQLINYKSSQDFTKMLVNIVLEEGVTEAVEAVNEIRTLHKDATFNFRTILEVAEFMEQSGKPETASRFKSLVDEMTQNPGG